MQHDLLHIQGKPYVLIPLHEYRMMATNGPDTPAGEDDLPQTLLDKIFTGQESPIRLLRKFRGLTQKDLAEASGLSRPYLTEIETGAKAGSLKALRAIARALDVKIGLLTGTA